MENDETTHYYETTFYLTPKLMSPQVSVNPILTNVLVNELTCRYRERILTSKHNGVECYQCHSWHVCHSGVLQSTS